jgi:hypothetical protein
MTVNGHVKNGTIVLDQPLGLPEGALVQVEIVPVEIAKKDEPGSLLDQLGDVVGAIDDLPADMARNHDHYLYGAPKQT